MSRPARRTGCAAPARWSICSSAASSDPQTGALIEFFAADWSPAPGEPGRLREPGHQFEWVWLLHEYYRLSRDESVHPLRGTAVRFRRRNSASSAATGWPARCSTASMRRARWSPARSCSGRRPNTSRRWWRAPNGTNDAAARAAISAHLALIAKYFLRPDGASWHNQLARDGKPLTPTTPARVLYHLFLAVAEVDRLWPLTRGQHRVTPERARSDLTAPPTPSGNSSDRDTSPARAACRPRCRDAARAA